MCAQMNFLGDDLLVILWGGEEHIGAVGMAQPRPSLSDPSRIGATSSVFTYVGHKEDVVVKMMSEGIAGGLNRKVVVVAGIHWDGITTEGIEIIMGLCGNILKKIVKEGRKWKKES